MDDMFAVTADDIAESKKGGFLEFKTGDTPVFLITAIKPNLEKKRLDIECQVVGGEHNDKKYTHFIPASNKRLYIAILNCFFTEAEIMAKPNVEEIIGRKWTATVRLTPSKQDTSKIFTNFNKLSAVSDVPDMGEAMGAPDTAPTTITDTDNSDVF